MKIYLKIILIVLSIVILYFLADIASIKLRNKPIIYISKEVNDTYSKYNELIYNSYYCKLDERSYIRLKTSDFVCPSENVNSNYIYAVVMEANEEGATIKGIKDNNSLNLDDVAYVIISEDTKIVGASSLKMGLRIKIEADLIQETYPIRILADKITVLESPSFTIIDETEMCAEALELIWSDYLYDYYLPCIKSANIKIKFETKEVLLKKSLEEHLITIEELMSNGLSLYKESN